ncbi:hypothetical protein BWQ96_00143 [Gracilariopsis chorda]|uniref:Uncharacterized protein n=1 Tax=Gracilariopsis chorda TaxID=448386 RepID=A0A2V3J6P9_9FLOR|nr:hypothetical protein BWQ96_00143 [Gracilariopsis chorda]|eukprot:PXF49983.1 hypothetical protein BWQ96_00143 [Gracilariopsis chorda]
MVSMREEVSVLKRARIMLLQRVLVVEAQVEDLRSAFLQNRRRQAFSNSLSIAIQLIPIAGGAVGNALLVGIEIAEGLPAGDVFDLAFSTAEVLLSEENLSRMDPRKRREMESVFHDYGYTIEDVQVLLRSTREVENEFSSSRLLEYSRDSETGGAEYQPQQQENEEVNEASELDDGENVGTAAFWCSIGTGWAQRFRVVCY